MMMEKRAANQGQPGVLETAAVGARPGEVSLPSDALQNMELSGLAFNDRVLQLGMDRGNPLLERVRFLAILGNNLDEFFMTRVAGFKQQLAIGTPPKLTLDGRTPEEQLAMIGPATRTLLDTAYREALPTLCEELGAHGIRLLSWSELEPEEVGYLESVYAAELEAVVRPVSVVPEARFPHVRNLRPALLVTIIRPDEAKPNLVIVELPSDVPRFIPLPGGRRFVPLEEVLRSNLPRLLDRGTVLESYLFRVTRSGNLRLANDEIADIVGAVAENVARRPFQPVVRLEVEASMPPSVRGQLLGELQHEARSRLSTLGEEDVYSIEGLIDLSRLEEIAGLPVPELHFPLAKRSRPVRKRPSIFEQMGARSILVRFPRDSFEKSVERFVIEAANDPKVRSIAITLYRTDRASRIVRVLRRAHRNGKKVVALIEVKASFDERRNIERGRALEAAGIRVLYGPPSLKVHAKIANVVREEDGGMRLYSYVGTGNLNASTAATYTDLGILTADPRIGEELGALFDAMAGGGTMPRFDSLLVAPFNMRSRFLELIEREGAHARRGGDGGITVKVNGLADREIIAALYRASAAGVRIRLVIRGICALRPKVPGLSENIEVVSIAGRYLEHSRIYRFANGGEAEYFIGSADWRGRNLSRRVEVATPVTDPGYRDVLDIILAEDLARPDAWDLLPDGSYQRRDGRIAASVQGP
ncbi:MAG: polyphosphate kinase 1 [Gemmatimonas sp.]|nr:polyphosphate kinase 1 [Gemmatimonas sp.]